MRVPDKNLVEIWDQGWTVVEGFLDRDTLTDAQDALWGIPLGGLGNVLLYISVALSLWSAKDYTIDFFRAFAEGRRKKALERRARKSRKPAPSGSAGPVAPTGDDA